MGRPFPVPADHWHVATSRHGEMQVSTERHDHATAIEMVRNLLLRDAHVTSDPEYTKGLQAIDRGYESYTVGRFFYVAIACACPATNVQRAQSEESAQLWSR